MVGRIESSLESRGKIIALWAERVPINEIAHRVDLSVSQVYRWIKRHRDGEDDPRPLLNKPRTGRNRTLSDEQMRQIEDLYEHQPFTSSSMVKEILDLPCTTASIRKNVRRLGFRNHRPAKKLALTAEHRRRRVEFAEENMNRVWVTQGNIITVFLDEKVFVSTEDGLRMKPLWRRVGTRYEPQNLLNADRSGRISCGFWGWMTADGPGDFIEVGGRLTGARYIELLGDELIPSIDVRYGPDYEVLLVQDNSSVHNSRQVQHFINDNERLTLLPWPAKSPDLNPIENLWGRMVQEWGPRRLLRTRQNLIDHANTVWEEIGQDVNYCNNLVASMQRRLQLVVNNNGHPIKY